MFEFIASFWDNLAPQSNRYNLLLVSFLVHQLLVFAGHWLYWIEETGSQSEFPFSCFYKRLRLLREMNYLIRLKLSFKYSSWHMFDVSYNNIPVLYYGCWRSWMWEGEKRMDVSFWFWSFHPWNFKQKCIYIRHPYCVILLFETFETILENCGGNLSKFCCKYNV